MGCPPHHQAKERIKQRMRNKTPALVKPVKHRPSTLLTLHTESRSNKPAHKQLFYKVPFWREAQFEEQNSLCAMIPQDQYSPDQWMLESDYTALVLPSFSPERWLICPLFLSDKSSIQCRHSKTSDVSPCWLARCFNITFMIMQGWLGEQQICRRTRVFFFLVIEPRTQTIKIQI